MLWLVELYCSFFSLIIFNMMPVFKRSYLGFQLVPEPIAAFAIKDSDGKNSGGNADLSWLGPQLIIFR